MLRLELDTSRGAGLQLGSSRSHSACPPHIPLPRLVWQGPAEPTPWTSEKKKSPAGSLLLRGDLFAQRPKSTRHHEGFASVAMQAHVQLGNPSRPNKALQRERQNSHKPGSLSFPRTKEAREQAVGCFLPPASLWPWRQGCEEMSGLESRASTS